MIASELACSLTPTYIEIYPEQLCDAPHRLFYLSSTDRAKLQRFLDFLGLSLDDGLHTSRKGYANRRDYGRFFAVPWEAVYAFEATYENRGGYSQFMRDNRF